MIYDSKLQNRWEVLQFVCEQSDQSNPSVPVPVDFLLEGREWKLNLFFPVSSMLTMTDSDNDYKAVCRISKCLKGTPISMDPVKSLQQSSCCSMQPEVMSVVLCVSGFFIVSNCHEAAAAEVDKNE